MTDIEALRARMREAAEKAELAGNKLCWGGVETVDREFYALASPANVKALDAEITRLREDLDRVTRERDEASREVARLVKAREDARGQWRSLAAERAVETSALKAALAKRDEEAARMREAAWLAEKAMDDCGDLRGTPAHEALIEALTKEPTNAER